MARRLDLSAEEIAEAYVAGMTLEEIAYVLDTSTQTVRLRLLAEGVQMRRRGPRDGHDVAERLPTRPPLVPRKVTFSDMTPSWLKPRFEPGDYIGTHAPLIHLPDAVLDALELRLCRPRQVMFVMTHDGDGLLPYSRVNGDKTPIPMINARHVAVTEPFADRPFFDRITSPCLRSIDGGKTWAPFRPKKRKTNPAVPVHWMHLLKADLRAAGLMT